jgi:hypothetical protein
MTLSPYQIVVPLLALVAIAYAWNLFKSNKKTLWEAGLWTLWWGAIAAVALFPNLLSYLTAVTGIKDQVNAVLATSIGILLFLVFYVIVRLEELEQRQTRIVRAVALREADLVKDEPKAANGKTGSN